MNNSMLQIIERIFSLYCCIWGRQEESVSHRLLYHGSLGIQGLYVFVSLFLSHGH